jgi:hypothetical protein
MTVEEAIQLATDSVKKHFEGSEFRLEEIELRDDGGFDVTVSFRPRDPARDLLKIGGESFAGGLQGGRAAVGIDPGRVYKDVQISKDGQVRSIRMRQIVLG